MSRKANQEIQDLIHQLLRKTCAALESSETRWPIAAGITRLGKIEFLFIQLETEATKARSEESLLIRIRQSRYSSAAMLENETIAKGTEIRIHAEHQSGIATTFRVAYKTKRPKRVTLGQCNTEATTPRWYRA